MDILYKIKRYTMTKLSIIIPIYNVEKYLNECLNSLLSFSKKTIEYILIDDGSTDSSYKIAELYTQKDNRFKLFTQKNQGLGAARNTGIKKAKGDYICFLDSDDYINTILFEELYNYLETAKDDIIVADYCCINDYKEVSYVSSHNRDLEEQKIYFKKILSGKIAMMVCNKIYKQKLFIDNDILFPKDVLYEDLIVTTKLSYYGTTIKYIPATFYCWREREGSLSRHVKMKNIDDRLLALKQIKEFLMDIKLYEKYKPLYMKNYALNMLEYMANAIEKYNGNSKLYSYLIENIKKENILDITLVESKYKKLYNSFLNLDLKGPSMELEENKVHKIETQAEINLDFSRKLNSLYIQIDNLKKDNYTYAIYGNGIIGNILKNNLSDKIIVTADQNINELNTDKTLCHPKDLKKYTFDKLIIAVLGREESIIEDLTYIYNIKKDKITSLFVTNSIILDLPILESEKDKIRKLKNKFFGKRCFIIGNGPSLNKCDLSLLKNEFTFGVNGIFYKTKEMGFKPTFYMVEDRAVMHDNTEEINNYNCEYKFFPSIYKDQITNKTDNTYFFRTDLGFYHKEHPSYCIPRFSYDFSEKAYTGQSVTILLIQLAYYLGFTEVYLIGMDYNYKVPKSTKITGDIYESNEDDPNHFHPDYFGKGKKWHDPKIERVGWNYEKAKKVFEDSNRTIKNATIGGKLEIFERIDFNSLF